MGHQHGLERHYSHVFSHRPGARSLLRVGHVRQVDGAVHVPGPGSRQCVPRHGEHAHQHAERPCVDSCRLDGEPLGTHAKLLSDALRSQQNFDGALLQLEAGRAPSTDYNFVAAYAANTLLWTLNSNGFIDSSAGATLRGPLHGTTATFSAGETISAGGLVVYGGEIVASGDVVVVDGTTTGTLASSALQSVATYTSTHAAFTSNVLALTASTTGGGFRCVRCSAVGIRAVLQRRSVQVY